MLQLVDVPLQDAGAVADHAHEPLGLDVEHVTHDDGRGKVELQADGDGLHGHLVDAGHEHGGGGAREDAPASAADGAHASTCP